MEDGKKYLTENQLRTIEQNSQSILTAKKDVEISVLKHTLAGTEMSLLDAQKQLKSNLVDQLEKDFKSAKEKHNALVQKTKNLSKELAEELNLSQNWGYDPLTGELTDE